MIYIFDEWLKNKKNEKEVRKIIEEATRDIRFENTEAEEMLKELGEYKILEELNKGSFSN